jgi:enoyl-CoA hydratase/carnithine racemase
MIPDRTEGPILSRQDGGVLLVTLNRPDSLNSFTLEMDSAYREVLAVADLDPDVRVVVVTGAGRGFCGGADVAMLEALANEPSREHFDAAFLEPLRLSKPLIAAINGACAGLGFVQALFCDIRIVANEAKLTTSFVQRGVIAEQGSALLLSRIVGDGFARDLLLSGRVITGIDAQRISLASESVPREEVLGRALAIAREISEKCAPVSMAIIKQQFRDLLLDDVQREATAALETLAGVFAGPDFGEGIASYLERREPAFRGYPSA